MPKEVTIDFDSAMAVLNNDSVCAGSKLIAACSVATLVAKAARKTTSDERSLAQRLLRMAASAIDEGIARDALN